MYVLVNQGKKTQVKFTVYNKNLHKQDKMNLQKNDELISQRR